MKIIKNFSIINREIDGQLIQLLRVHLLDSCRKTIDFY